MENQKLLYKGKKASQSPEDTVYQVGLRNGTKVQMLGSTSEEIGDMRAVEDDNKKKERILKERDEKYRNSKVCAQLYSSGQVTKITPEIHSFQYLHSLVAIPVS